MKTYFRLQILACLFGWATALTAQHPLLNSGPMVGAADMNRVKLWVQTTEPTMVQVEYWPIDTPSAVRATPSVVTNRQAALTAHLEATDVLPGQTYAYKLYLDNEPVDLSWPLKFQTPPHWHYRTDPPEFTVAVGSCSFTNDPATDRPGDGYGENFGIYQQIHALRPDLMLWLGDNVYFRETDWTSRLGMQRRYTKTRRLPEMQPLLGSTHHFAIWDDHDFGPNNSDGAYLLKDTALQVFQQFWANPTYGVPDAPGCATSFQWGDVDFFLLDNRYHRSSNTRVTGPDQLLGEAQFQWLISALKFSRAPFKVVCIGGQVLNPLKQYETYANLVPQERDRLLKTLQEEGIDGVMFFTGDRHHTEISTYEPEGFYPLHDFTISPLTSHAYDASEEENPLRDDATLIGTQNFALLKFTGPRTDRVMTITTYTHAGESVWTRAIRASDLSLPREAGEE